MFAVKIFFKVESTSSFFVIKTLTFTVSNKVYLPSDEISNINTKVVKHQNAWECFVLNDQKTLV